MVTKTYFWTNKKENILPAEFVAARNKKWIVVEECKATVKDTLIGDVIMHADFIQRDAFLDSSCCFVNEEANRDTAKYEIINYQPGFKIWFTDFNQKPVEPEAFTIRLILIY